MEALVQLLHLSDIGVQLGAMKALVNAAFDSTGNRSKIVGAGTVPRLVQLIHGGSGSSSGSGSGADSEDLRKHAVMLLANLCTDGSRAAVVAAGGIPALLWCLQPSSGCSEAVQVAALVALSHMCQHLDVVPAVAAAGGMQVLVQHLRTGKPHPQAAHCTVGVLAQLSTLDHSVAASIATAGAVPVLTRRLHSSELEPVRQNAAACLSNMGLHNRTACASIIAAGAIPLLLQCVSGSSNEPLQHSATIALLSLSHHSGGDAPPLILDAGASAFSSSCSLAAGLAPE